MEIKDLAIQLWKSGNFGSRIDVARYIDLQDYDNEGYNIIDELKAYNAKSVNKIKNRTKIMEIVI